MPVTLEEIAKQVGISKATVSRALKNDRLIHPETRSLVLEAAARAGYERPVRKTRQGEKKSTHILLLIPTLARPDSHALSWYLRGLTRAASEAGCHLSVEALPESEKVRNRLPRELRERKIDAVIIADKHDPENLKRIADALPIVSIQWDHSPLPMDLVSAYNYRGISDMVRHVAQKGHRKIAWVGAMAFGGGDTSFYIDRAAGFLKGSLAHKLELNLNHLFAVPEEVGGSDALSRLVKSGVTAIICANDNSARKIWGLAGQAGLRIPEDLSLTGYDAEPNLLANGKMLTSYDPCFSELGRMAVTAVLQRLKDPGAPRMIYMQEGRIRDGETVSILDR